MRVLWDARNVFLNSFHLHTTQIISTRKSHRALIHTQSFIINTREKVVICWFFSYVITIGLNSVKYKTKKVRQSIKFPINRASKWELLKVKCISKILRNKLFELFNVLMIQFFNDDKCLYLAICDDPNIWIHPFQILSYDFEE